MSEKTTARVDEAGNVYVLEESGERLIGQYADVSADEAIAYFERKFNETNSALVLLEQRSKNGAPAKEIAESAKKLGEAVSLRAGIGNYDALATRLAALTEALSDLSAAEKEQNAAALEEARAARLIIVEAIEALAATDPAKANWKQITAAADDLFTQWQESQKSSPRLGKAESNDLWKRFRDARQKIDQGRRAYFAELDTRNKGAKSAKEELIARAEALAPQGSAGIPAYRALLDQWKASPRAGKKIDDALWDRFKAAGDALYSAKATEVAAEEEEFAGNVDAKMAILTEAELLLTATDAASARSTLNQLQKKWDAAGKLPRSQMKVMEDRMRKVENAVRKLEDEVWTKSDPDKLARTEGLAEQLEAKIAKLEKDLAAAEAAKDSKAIASITDAISIQKTWLAVLK
jgi:hypothetical protein